MPRLVLALSSLIAAACAGPAEFVHRPKEPVAWPYADATPRVELELVYGGSQDVVRHPGFFAWLANAFGGENEVHLVSPAGMCHIGEMLWIADPGAACVHRLSFVSGEHLQFAGSTEHPFATPIGVANAGDGGIYVTDSGTGYVTQLTAEGNATRCFGGPELAGRPTGICFDRARRQLVVVDTTGCRLHVFDAEGKWIRSVGTRGTEPGQFNYPTHADLMRDGGIVVVDSLNFRVQRLSPDLEPVASFGRVGRGPGDFANPKGVAVDAADRIWVVDSMFDNVQVFDPDGRLLLAVGSSGNADGQLYLPTGIHIDADGRIHVADAGNSRIQILLLKEGVQ
jgi:sugar lactone lactonase YvrE